MRTQLTIVRSPLHTHLDLQDLTPRASRADGGSLHPNQSSATRLSKFLCSCPTPALGSFTSTRFQVIKMGARPVSSKSPSPTPGVLGMEDRPALYPCPSPKPLTYSNSFILYVQSLIPKAFPLTGSHTHLVTLAFHQTLVSAPSAALVFPQFGGYNEGHPRPPALCTWTRRLGQAGLQKTGCPPRSRCGPQGRSWPTLPSAKEGSLGSTLVPLPDVLAACGLDKKESNFKQMADRV